MLIKCIWYHNSQHFCSKTNVVTCQLHVPRVNFPGEETSNDQGSHVEFIPSYPILQILYCNVKYFIYHAAIPNSLLSRDWNIYGGNRQLQHHLNITT